MNKRLVVFGDSFIDGLIKDPDRNPPEEREQIRFTTHLSKLLNIEIINEGFSGGMGLNGLTWKIWDWVNNNTLENTYILVFWSGPGRYHTYDPVNNRYKINHEEMSKYHIDFENEINIRAILNLLKDKVPLLMSNSFFDFKYLSMSSSFKDDVKDYWIEPDAYNNTLMDIICKRFLDNNPIEKWWLEHSASEVNNEYIAPCKHPSALGHKLIANTLLPYLENFINK